MRRESVISLLHLLDAAFPAIREALAARGRIYTSIAITDVDLVAGRIEVETIGWGSDTDPERVYLSIDELVGTGDTAQRAKHRL